MFLKKKQQSLAECIDADKLRLISSKISVWDLFCIPQADYLALDKTEKSRMLNEYHTKLVAQYFGDGKNSLFFVWKLSEKKSVLAFVSYFIFLLSDLLLFYGIFFR